MIAFLTLEKSGRVARHKLVMLAFSLIVVSMLVLSFESLSATSCEKNEKMPSRDFDYQLLMKNSYHCSTPMSTALADSLIK